MRLTDCARKIRHRDYKAQLEIKRLSRKRRKMGYIKRGKDESENRKETNKQRLKAALDATYGPERWGSRWDSNVKRDISRDSIDPLNPLYCYKPLLEGVWNRPDLRPYYTTATSFLDYLIRAEENNIEIKQYDDDGIISSISFKYPTRWNVAYRKMVIAKMYQLEKGLQGWSGEWTLMTLTTYQGGSFSKREVGGYSIPQSFEVLATAGRALMRQVTTKIAPNVQYLWVTEPHMENDSGYPHRHYVLQTSFTNEQMERIRNLWAHRYRAGSESHGIDFSVRSSDGSIQSIRNYLLKYLEKDINYSELTPGLLMYHAVAYKNHNRFFGSSRDFSSLMKRNCITFSVALACYFY